MDVIPRSDKAGPPMFEGDAAIRLVNSEVVLLLGAGRALLMQLAHPRIAAAVAEHSGFQDRGLVRLTRTLRAVYTIVFGSETEAYRTAAHVNALHARVQGEGYSALDPELLQWVHATLVDTALRTYRLFVAPLGAEKAERYYQDTVSVGELFLLSRNRLAPDLATFHGYVRAMVATLAVSDTARSLAQALFRPQPAPAAPLIVLAREVTAGLLPSRLRAQYGFTWDRRRAASLRTSAALSRSLMPYLPHALRRPPLALMPGGTCAARIFDRASGRPPVDVMQPSQHRF